MVEDIYALFQKPKNPRDFDAIRIKLASPEKMREWSHGEVKKPETINYRTFKPEHDGLFCAKIFGPVKDWECLCGKYKRMKHRGVICDKCGVEVIQSKARRERMGHIELATPVAHVWFLRGVPSRIGTLLDMTIRQLEKVLYFEEYVVIDPGDTPLKARELLSEEEYKKKRSEFSNRFKAGMGAEAVRELLKKVDLDVLSKELKDKIDSVSSLGVKRKLTKRLKIVDSFLKSFNRPDWMILDIVPVLPPDLRPLVPLDGGRFATSDLNDLYRRVINRNNRLKRLMELKAPSVIIKNEKRMLQEAVDALFDNTKKAKVLKAGGKRVLKSLSDMIKGKQGRFRQNLLGKRVDYSGRSVIVVGPELELHQCGLPKRMALELFKPFVFHKLEEKGHSTTIKQAKRLLERERPEVWDCLEEVIQEHPVLLNRAPTLHRLGIQAFDPILVEGKAIKLHPLVCTAFNADFDGDQMAVHVPLSIEAQIEARVLMLSVNNLLSPANGKPIVVPTQDMVLGIYYLTKAKGVIYESLDEVKKALEGRKLRDTDKVYLKYRLDHKSGHIVVRGTCREIIGWAAKPSDRVPAQVRIFSDPDEVLVACSAIRRHDRDHRGVEGERQDTITLDEHDWINVRMGEEVVVTTAGRIIFSQILPADIPFSMVNKELTKKELGKLLEYIHKFSGKRETVVFLNRLERLGFQYATQSGVSISIDDMHIPRKKPELIREAEQEVMEVQRQYEDGLITQGERYNKVIDIWAQVTEKVANEMMEELGSDEAKEFTEEELKESRSFNSIYMMADSGARGSTAQIRQLAGMRGLMAKPSGEIIETPITANFREGLTPLQYFISTHGARKGLADTALKTANAGYLTRRLVDVAQDVILSEPDCGTKQGITVSALIEGGEVIQTLEDRIFGRCLAETIKDPIENEVIATRNQEVDDELARKIVEAGIDRVKIRSVLTCESKVGVCGRCYGRDLARGEAIEIGEAIGIIAAQSIGEPGTQLTMRTFHIGGAATKVVEQANLKAKNSGKVKFIDVNAVKKKDLETNRDISVVLNRNAMIAIVDRSGREKEKYNLVYGARIFVENDKRVEAGELMVEWDPYSTPILTEIGGKIAYGDIVEGQTFKEELDEISGLAQRVVIDYPASMRPRISIKDELNRTAKIPGTNNLARYLLPAGAHIMQEKGAQVAPGDTLAKIPRETTKTKDITGGLPRVAELLEARRPKEQAMVTEIDGTVEFRGAHKGMRVVVVKGGEESREYLIPKGKHVTVHEGDWVKAGEPLMDGSINPHNILEILGPTELQRYLVDEVQKVYRLQGVTLNDKHIEVIVRQMMKRIRIDEPGDTSFLIGDEVDRITFVEENERVRAEDGKPAQGSPLLLGITKASLSTDSWVSAASFQETTRVLTHAALAGAVDELRGLKENVIMGRIIPAGSGMPVYYRDTYVPSEFNLTKPEEQELAEN